MPLPPLDTSKFGPITRLRAMLIERQVMAHNRRSEASLARVPGLLEVIRNYSSNSDVTGASMSDYLTLYTEVRKRKPKEILELGTGVSTVVLAMALQANAAEGAPLGRVTSMEEDQKWYQTALDNLPESVAGVVEIVHSPKVDGYYKIFRGVQYKDVPDRPYEFVFSDGPERHSPVNGDKLFDLDLINVVRRSEIPITAVVDDHYLTFYVLQKVFGTRLARYNASARHMFVGPVTKHDVRHLSKENFVPDLRLLGRTKLELRMAAGSR